MEINEYVTTDIHPSVFEFINHICTTVQIMNEMWPLHKTIKCQSLLPIITKVDIIDLLYVQYSVNEEYIRTIHHMIQDFVLCTGTIPVIHKDFTLCKKSLHNISYYMTLYKTENKKYLVIFYS